MFEYMDIPGVEIDGGSIENLNEKEKKRLDRIYSEVPEYYADAFNILNANVRKVDKDITFDFVNDLTIVSFLLVKADEYNDPGCVSFAMLESGSIDPDILDYARRNKIDEVWEELFALTKKYLIETIGFFGMAYSVKNEDDDTASDSLADYKEYGNATMAPEALLDLANNILDVQDGEKFADLCCRTGRMAMRVAEFVTNTFITGFDIDADAIAVAKVHQYFETKNKFSFEQKNIFELKTPDDENPVFDKIYANYPFGARIRDVDFGDRFLEETGKRIPAIARATSSDWLFNLQIVDLLAENGKAVGIMTNGSTWNHLDAPIREYFVENGLVECVITLPPRLAMMWNTSISMIVFSHGNKGVRLVDASMQYDRGRRINSIPLEKLEKILDDTKEDSEHSVFVPKEELRENDYVLNATRYLQHEVEIENGVAFETIIKRISRGASLNANELDKITSYTPTDMQYLKLSHVQNGLIEQNLPYLSKIEKKYEKYCLTDHCLILSKNGYPYKAAVVEHKGHNKILANGNLYLIELDEEKADPYYIAAFLNSERGIAALKSITVGATIPNIGVDSLKKIKIPLPAIEDQHKIGEKYQIVRDEISLLQLKLEKAKTRLAEVFGEE